METPPSSPAQSPAGILAKIDAHFTGSVSYKELAAALYILWVNLH